MEQRTRVIIIGAVALLIVAAVLAAIVLIGRISSNTPRLSDNPDISLEDLLATPQVTPGANTPVPTLDVKTYAAEGYSFTYPRIWGSLSCSNSQNIELDPNMETDFRDIVCDVAVKPITILQVAKLNCLGETVTIGNHSVSRSKVVDQDGYTKYRWCLSIGGKNLDITHRVSQNPDRATSRVDYSVEVESIIKSIQATPRGS